MALKAIDSLDTLMGGAARERFRDAWNQALKNAIDPNTNPKFKRTISITLTVTPDADRKTIGMTCDVKARLAAPATLSKTCMLERDTKGNVAAYESADQLPGQMDLEDAVPPAETAGDEANVVRFKAAK